MSEYATAEYDLLFADHTRDGQKQKYIREHTGKNPSAVFCGILQWHGTGTGTV